MIKAWLKSRKNKRNSHMLYTALVTQARSPVFYTKYSVDDSIDGRFDMILLHMFALVYRLEQMGKPAKNMARVVQEVMITDLDYNLREMGVGDMSVGKKMKDIGKAWFGRQRAYRESFDNVGELEAAICRNIYRGKQNESASVLAVYLTNLMRYLQTIDHDDLLSGKLKLPDAAQLITAGGNT